MKPAWLRDLTISKVALCAQGMNPEAEIALFKSAEVPTPMKEATPVADDIVAKSDHDAVVAELEAAKAELAALTEMTDDDLAALRGFEIAKAESVEDDILKGVPEDVRKRLEDAEATIAKMERDRRLDSFVKAAKADYGTLATDELGSALEEIDRVAPEAAKTVTQTLKAAAARIDTTELFKELGSDGAPAGDDEANVLIAKAIEAGLSRAEAIRKVFTERPDLYPVTLGSAE